MTALFLYRRRVKLFCPLLKSAHLTKSSDSEDGFRTVQVFEKSVAWTLATFRLQYEDEYEYEFSVLSTRFRFGGRKFSKCACSEFKIVLVLQSEESEVVFRMWVGTRM